MTKPIRSTEGGVNFKGGGEANKKHLCIFIFPKMTSKSTLVLPSCRKTAGLMWSDPAPALQIKGTSITAAS